MEADTDYYATLGVPPSADGEAIRAAYRALAQKHHPDRAGGDPAAVARMTAINEAYRILGDPQRRAGYDRLRAHPATGARAGQGTQPGRDRRPPATYRPPRPERVRRGGRWRWGPSLIERTAELTTGCLVVLIAGVGVVLFVGLLVGELPGGSDLSQRPPEEVPGQRSWPGPDWGQSIGLAPDETGEPPLSDASGEPMQEDGWDDWDSGDDWDDDGWDRWEEQAPEPILP